MFLRGFRRGRTAPGTQKSSFRALAENNSEKGPDARGVLDYRCQSLVYEDSMHESI